MWRKHVKRAVDRAGGQEQDGEQRENWVQFGHFGNFVWPQSEFVDEWENCQYNWLDCIQPENFVFNKKLQIKWNCTYYQEVYVLILYTIDIFKKYNCACKMTKHHGTHCSCRSCKMPVRRRVPRTTTLSRCTRGTVSRQSICQGSLERKATVLNAFHIFQTFSKRSPLSLSAGRRLLKGLGSSMTAAATPTATSRTTVRLFMMTSQLKDWYRQYGGPLLSLSCGRLIAAIAETGAF